MQLKPQIIQQKWKLTTYNTEQQARLEIKAEIKTLNYEKTGIKKTETYTKIKPKNLKLKFNQHPVLPMTEINRPKQNKKQSSRINMN